VAVAAQRSPARRARGLLAKLAVAYPEGVAAAAKLQAEAVLVSLQAEAMGANPKRREWRHLDGRRRASERGRAARRGR
jgi:hypothetical protein